ncbi:MAG: transglutaminase family protein [Planctomycetota bacterium]
MVKQVFGSTARARRAGTIGPSFAFLLTTAVCVAALVWVSGQPLRAGEPQAKEEAKAEASLLDRVLELNHIQEPELDAEAARREFAALLAQVKTALADAQTPRDKVAAVSKTLLANREVTYLSNLYWRDSTLAASLLRRKGNCLATSTLFVLVGEALGLPIRMVVVPRHAFARWDEGQTKINIETTQQGIEIPDSVYRSSVRPLLTANEKCVIYLLSTPNGRGGHFYRASSNPRWDRYEIRSPFEPDDVQWTLHMHIPEPEYRAQRIEKGIKAYYSPRHFNLAEQEENLEDMGPRMYRQEECCEFVESEFQVFNNDDIEAMYSDAVKPMTFGTAGVQSEAVKELVIRPRGKTR